MKKHDPNSNHDGTKRKNTVLMDQHGRNVQHGPISNRAVTIKQRRVGRTVAPFQDPRVRPDVIS